MRDGGGGGGGGSAGYGHGHYTCICVARVLGEIGKGKRKEVEIIKEMTENVNEE